MALKLLASIMLKAITLTSLMLTDIRMGAITTGKRAGRPPLTALRQRPNHRPNHRWAPLLSLVLLTAACGGGDDRGGGPGDTTRPGVQIQGAPDSHDGRTAFTLAIRFSESVSGFERGDIGVTGAAVTAFSGSGARYTATFRPGAGRAIGIGIAANVAEDAAGNGNTPSARQRVAYLPPLPPGKARISGRLTFDRVPLTDRGLDYGRIRQEPIRGVWVDAVNAGGAVLERTRSDADGRYRLDVAANTEVRIRISAHMQRTEAGGPRWDVKVSDNTSGNALYVAQSDLLSSGTGFSTRNLNAPSGWVAANRRYANPRAAGPFAVLSFTYDALQKLAEADLYVKLPALEYRWSPDNRSASGNLADGAIGGSFYDSRQRLIYLRGKENEDTDEYDQSVILHEFAHHFQSALSRDDSPGGRHTLNAPLDMRLAFSEGFANALGAMIADDPVYRDSFGPGQASAGGYDNEVNPVNSPGDPHRIGWYHSHSVAAMLYDLYDAANEGADPLNLGFAPIYNTLTGDGFKNNRYYTSIYTFANQLLAQAPNRAATQRRLDALLRRHNIFGRGDKGLGETNRGGLPATARVLPVYKSIGAGDAPITLCSVDDAGARNRLGNYSFVEVRFAESGSHTLMMTNVAGARGTLPWFLWRPYRGDAAIRGQRQWAREPRSQTATRDFQAGEPALVQAADFRNLDDDAGNDGDGCFTLSVVKNP